MKKILTWVMLACLLATACKKNDLSVKKEDKTTSYRKVPLRPGVPPSDASKMELNFQNGKKMTVFKKDSLYFVEGDMVFTQKQIDAITQYNATSARTFTSNILKLWPNGVVPYVINGAFSANDQSNILYGISQWQGVGGLNFVQRTNQTNYIEFMVAPANTSSNSPVGMIGGRQVIYLVVDPFFGVDFSSTAHEVGHSLGLMHEVS